MPTREPIIEIQDLHYTYPNGQKALQGINLAVFAGEKVALVGPNGAGKSTLLLQLNGILQGKGQVRIAGLELNKRTLRRIRGLVGLVFQDPDDQLFSSTVFEDVAFGPLYMGLPEEEVRRRVKEALQAVGLEGFENRVPHHLSQGQKKRVAIATVLAMEPHILALDEPTSELDPRTRRALIRLLQDLPQTLLVATHDMRLVATLCERTVILDEGQIVADGPTAELLADEPLLERHGLESPYAH